MDIHTDTDMETKQAHTHGLRHAYGHTNTDRHTLATYMDILMDTDMETGRDTHRNTYTETYTQCHHHMPPPCSKKFLLYNQARP
jgi:hypothetical protein